jgi:helix-turn-helix protein
LTPDELELVLASLTRDRGREEGDTVKHALPRPVGACTAKPDRFPVVNLNLRGPRRGRQPLDSNQADRYLALVERLRDIEGMKATPKEAQAAVSTAASLAGLTEAGLLLDCHRRTVRAYIRAGLLPGLFLAGRWKVRLEDLQTFIEAAARARNGLKPRT